MPCAADSPMAWMSLMNMIMPASRMVFVMPNSLAALIALVASAPAFARARISALLLCACSRNDEKSPEDKGCFTEPTTVPPPALTTVVVSACSAWPNA
ncbi:hypothetical protein D3C85_1664700 [compost metagenome]